MEAQKLVLPSRPNFPVCVLAEDQPQYKPLPVASINYQGGEQVLISRYLLTWWERLCVLFGGSVWVEQMTLGQPLQPQLLHVTEPLKDDKFAYTEVNSGGGGGGVGTESVGKPIIFTDDVVANGGVCVGPDDLCVCGKPHSDSVHNPCDELCDDDCRCHVFVFANSGVK
jgi:hypothetical protein